MAHQLWNKKCQTSVISEVPSLIELEFVKRIYFVFLYSFVTQLTDRRNEKFMYGCNGQKQAKRDYMEDFSSSFILRSRSYCYMGSRRSCLSTSQ